MFDRTGAPQKDAILELKMHRNTFALGALV